MPDCPTDIKRRQPEPPTFTIYGRLWNVCPIADINGVFILAVSAVAVKYEKPDSENLCGQAFGDVCNACRAGDFTPLRLSVL